jgi:predicted amidohydrolase
MKKNLKVAVLQMTSVDDVESNVNQILRLLASIQNQNVQIVFLPENCLYMRIQEGSTIPAVDLNHPMIKKLQAWVDQQNCRLHLGSVPAMWEQKLTNATVWMEPGLKPHILYKKIHLFDIELHGQKPIRESDVFSHGEEPSILSFQNWNIGQTICYDLRFSELFNYYAYNHADIIAVPSSFLVKTGEAHWEVLCRC